MLTLTLKLNDEVLIEHEGKKLIMFIEERKASQYKVKFGGDSEMVIRRVLDGTMKDNIETELKNVQWSLPKEVALDQILKVLDKHGFMAPSIDTFLRVNFDEHNNLAIIHKLRKRLDNTKGENYEVV